DRVASQLQDVAPVVDDDLDELTEVLVEPLAQLLRTVRTALGKLLGKCGEAGDVGEEDRPGESLRLVPSGVSFVRTLREPPQHEARDKTGDGISRHSHGESPESRAPTCLLGVMSRSIRHTITCRRTGIEW